jgi:hypothetical protein
VASSDKYPTPPKCEAELSEIPVLRTETEVVPIALKTPPLSALLLE